jgi:hypothetical protein
VLHKRGVAHSADNVSAIQSTAMPFYRWRTNWPTEQHLPWDLYNAPRDGREEQAQGRIPDRESDKLGDICAIGSA